MIGMLKGLLDLFGAACPVDEIFWSCRGWLRLSWLQWYCSRKWVLVIFVREGRKEVIQRHDESQRNNAEYYVAMSDLKMSERVGRSKEWKVGYESCHIGL